MSINNLFSPNDFNLYCNSITSATGDVIGGNLTVNGVLTANGDAFFNNGIGVTHGSVDFASGITVYGGVGVYQDGISFQSPYTTPYTLSFYEYQTPTISFSGPWAAPLTSVCSFTRVGNMVTLTLVGVLSANSSSSVITASMGLSDFYPSHTIIQMIPVVNNNSTTQGQITISSAGVITISVGFGSPFTNVGVNCGFTQNDGISISYSI